MFGIGKLKDRIDALEYNMPVKCHVCKRFQHLRDCIVRSVYCQEPGRTEGDFLFYRHICKSCMDVPEFDRRQKPHKAKK